MNVVDQVNRIKKEKGIQIFAHYYQVPEIQEVADFVGDSLAMAQEVLKSDAQIIVVAGVRFMAETAKLLNSNKKVLLPDLNAGCSLVESCPPHLLKEFIDKHPGHLVVTYINSSVEVKELSDIICTSSNAVQIINSIPKNQPILFTPDEHLGRYLAQTCNRHLVLWKGACTVHQAFSLKRIKEIASQYPNAKLIAHPESNWELLKLADFIGSTQKLLNYVQNDQAQEFIVATEMGILHKMKSIAKDKLIIPAPTHVQNTCACSECIYMKQNTLRKLYECMVSENPEIQIPDTQLERASRPIWKMLEMTVKG